MCQSERLVRRKDKKEIQAPEFQTNHINVRTHSSVLSVIKAPSLAPVRCSFSLYGGGCGELTSMPPYDTVP